MAAAPGANPDAMAVEGPQRGQALRPDNAAAAVASSVMQLEDAHRAGGRVVSFVQEFAASGRPDTFAFTSQKTDGAYPDMDVENKIQGGGGPFVGGGSRIGRSRSRGRPPLSDMDSSSNTLLQLLWRPQCTSARTTVVSDKCDETKRHFTVS